jgi:hypothetical protein
MPFPLPPPFCGFGVGLRPVHYQDFLDRDQPVDFVEIISENFMVDGGRPLQVLDRIRERYPVAMHGVSMSVGSADGVSREYLGKLKRLAHRLDPLWVSDHLCWTAIEGFNSHDLLPVPYCEETLEIVAANIMQAQDVLERAMLIENPSSYVTFAQDDMSEWQFMSELCKRTGCGILLDVNNIFVSASNHGFDALAYLDGIPAHHVRQIHLAGHSQGKDVLIDTHDQPVPHPVWALYRRAIGLVGDVATMVERDDNIPPLPELLAELGIARAVAADAKKAMAA